MSMKKEIVYTDKYALILSDAEINQGDYIKPNRYETCIKATEVHTTEFMGNGALNDCKLIIAHLPLSDAPILEGVPLLPPLPQGENIEALAEQEFPTSSSDLTLTVANNVICQAPFVKGYNKAKEKYKFTEDDMRKAIQLAQFNDDGAILPMREDEIIQSLQQQRPTYFVPELECCGNYSPPCYHNCEYGGKIKTTTNSQGQVELVGKYLTK